MDNRILGIDAPRPLSGIGERRGRRSKDESFRRALEEAGQEEAPEGGDSTGPMPVELQRPTPIVRRDDQDGTVHIDVLA